MKIYTVYGGVVVSAEVRETKKMYIIDENVGGAFGWRSQFYKEYACITPEEAITEEYNLALESEARCKSVYNTAKIRLEAVMKLKIEEDN